MKYRKQVEWAIKIIQRNYILWKRRQFLITLPMRLQPNSLSPICYEWPQASKCLSETSSLLKTIFHRWRVKQEKKFKIIFFFINFLFQCHKYRKIFDQTARNRMREKVTASILFKERKASYVKR